MNNEQFQKEDKSLLEVREWKEQCRQETEHLTPEEYLNWLRTTTEQLLARYHLTLQVVQR
jgi:hypothetical protein